MYLGDCVTVGEAEFCYYETRRTFGEAEDFCKTKRGHLVSINSAAEQTAVENLLNSVAAVGTKRIYIGYVDKQATGTNWNWLDGKGGYTNWETNYPLEGALGTVIEIPKGKWKNSICSNKLPFVCRSVSYSIVLI